jgi:hypothetical protein
LHQDSSLSNAESNQLRDYEMEEQQDEKSEDHSSGVSDLFVEHNWCFENEVGI